MSLLFFPINYPILFWFFAITLSVFQGIRGIFIQKRRVKQKNNIVGIEKYIHYYIHDFILNFICSIAGFLAYVIIAWILLKVKELDKIESGTGIIISIFSLIAITGIGGVLPHLLVRGKFPTK